MSENDGIGVGNESRRALVAGVITGALIAIGFALVISLFPESWFLEPGQRVILFAVQVVAAPVFVFVARAIGKAASAPERSVLMWAIAGALAFDGVLIAFVPSLYGQTGEALTMVAATLLWAFAWIVAAAMLLTPQPHTSGQSQPVSR